MQGANTLRIKIRKKPLLRNAWAPRWAELCEVILGNYGLEPDTPARQPAWAPSELASPSQGKAGEGEASLARGRKNVDLSREGQGRKVTWLEGGEEMRRERSWGRTGSL